jgi:RNA polymerase sigma-70 factor (ECF subfamily)
VVKVAGRSEAEATVRSLIEADYARVVRAVALVAGDVDDAEDAVQEALARLWHAVDRGEEIAAPRAWLIVVSLNLVRSRLRRARRYQQLLLRLVAAPDSPIVRDSADVLAVRAALARLPRRQREAVVLFYWLDLSVNDAARAMGASVGMVKNALFRARKSLTTWLSEPEEGEPDGR